jgi:hypothetical protein
MLTRYTSRPKRGPAINVGNAAPDTEHNEQYRNQNPRTGTARSQTMLRPPAPGCTTWRTDWGDRKSKGNLMVTCRPSHTRPEGGRMVPSACTVAASSAMVSPLVLPHGKRADKLRCGLTGSGITQIPPCSTRVLVFRVSEFLNGHSFPDLRGSIQCLRQYVLVVHDFKRSFCFARRGR